MKNTILFFTFLIVIGSSQGQELQAYQIYSQKGEQVTFSKMIDALSEYDIILFGEYHNNAINHWLQLKTEKALYELIGERLVLGAEMLERDNQKQVNKYLAGEIDSKTLKDSARLWSNFKTDYKPLLDFAKENNLPFIATNVPRRYAKVVSHFGLDSLEKLPKKTNNILLNCP